MILLSKQHMKGRRERARRYILRYVIALLSLLALPLGAQAEIRDMPSSAHQCLRWLVDGELFLTNAMFGISKEDAGEPSAGPGVDFSYIPHEHLIFRTTEASGANLETCAAYPHAPVSGWTLGSVTSVLQAKGLVHEPACESSEEADVWLLPGLTALGRKLWVSVWLAPNDEKVRGIYLFQAPGDLDVLCITG